ncbi:hypothetical protein N0K08_14620 [Acidovorax sp. Be4]|uniref:YHYH domain-containing protein n=1 Tax=Acidovorax bellezanensis TaxID=2976702 RepID=A0ABT2PPQ3_9BURK|nr:hypothetical protein [Acidovorax sp. Be4]MCT9811876.1 hypothetical protein [Acidovorax sp. Be4]
MRVSVLALLFLWASLAQATPGGVNASGCHHSQKKDFHCHAPNEKGKAKNQGSAETPAQRDKRLLRECRGRPNAGACLGYARQSK